MAKIPIGRLVKAQQKPICRDCPIYFSMTVLFSNIFQQARGRSKLASFLSSPKIQR